MRRNIDHLINEERPIDLNSTIHRYKQWNVLENTHEFWKETIEIIDRVKTN